MKATVVTIHEAKTNLSQLLRRASDGEEIIISRGSKPVARLVPIGETKGKREPGSLNGRFSISPEFFEPLPDDEISAWE
jgi:prevent-host-death family protein